MSSRLPARALLETTDGCRAGRDFFPHMRSQRAAQARHTGAPQRSQPRIARTMAVDPRTVLPRARGAGAGALEGARRVRALARAAQGRGAVRVLRGPADGERAPRARTMSSRACSRTSIPRYKTMRGHYVERKGGWDCHGLPVEIAVEQQLGIIDEGRDRGVRHRRVQPALPRVGLRVPRGLERADGADRLLAGPRQRLPHARRDLRRVGLVGAAPDRRQGPALRGLQGRPVLPALRHGAVAATRSRSGYKDVEDPSVYVRFPVAEDGGPLQAGDELLIWTTTPWTLVSNAAVAVDPELQYVRAKTGRARRAGGARRGARRARCSARTCRSSTASPALRWTACATSRRSGSSRARSTASAGTPCCSATSSRPMTAPASSTRRSRSARTTSGSASSTG